MTAPLTVFKQGAQVLLEALYLDEQNADRLREMGLVEGVHVRILQNTDKLIVQTGATRLGLRRDQAHLIFATEALAA